MRSATANSALHFAAAGLFACAFSLTAEPAAASGSGTAPSKTLSPAMDVTSADVAPARGKHVFFGCCMLYVPSYFTLSTERAYDVVVHFHGRPQIVEDTVEEAGVNAIVVSVNYGIGSSAYSGPYQYPGSVDQLFGHIDRAVAKSGIKGAHLGRIALAAWSAGFAGVGAILSKSDWADRIDAVLLADGFHEMYAPSGEVYRDGLQKYVRFADRAARGETLFAMTHSSIRTIGYASTTKATHTLLDMITLARSTRDGTGPRGMQLLYEAHRGNFHVAGYGGLREPDHIDHFKGMGQTLFPLLKSFWQPTSHTPSNSAWALK